VPPAKARKRRAPLPRTRRTPHEHGPAERRPALPSERAHDLTTNWDTGPYDDADGTPVLAGQRLVHHYLAVSSADLRRQHRDDGAPRELANLVDRMARQVDLLDDQMRSKAASIRDRLAPLASGNHRGVDTNGVLRLGAMDLEVLGIRYAQSVDQLEHAVLAYQRALPAPLPAEPAHRQQAARSRSTNAPDEQPQTADAPGRARPPASRRSRTA
jgi:hypothetical protein